MEGKIALQSKQMRSVEQIMSAKKSRNQNRKLNNNKKAKRGKQISKQLGKEYHTAELASIEEARQGL